MASISFRQFGNLYHGTNVPRLSEIDQRRGKINSGAMSGIRGYNFASTSLDTALEYARGSKSGPAVVYRVSPKYSSYPWLPDPHSGPMGWNDGPKNKREALYNHEGGGEVSLKFSSPLKAEEIIVEDRAEDITPSRTGNYMDKGLSFS